MARFSLVFLKQICLPVKCPPWVSVWRLKDLKNSCSNLLEHWYYHGFLAEVTVSAPEGKPGVFPSGDCLAFPSISIQQRTQNQAWQLQESAPAPALRFCCFWNRFSLPRHTIICMVLLCVCVIIFQWEQIEMDFSVYFVIIKILGSNLKIYTKDSISFDIII